MKKIFVSLLMGLLLVSQVYAADQWDKTDPAGTESPADLDTLITANNEALDRGLKNYREGCKLSYATAATVSVAAGEVFCSNSGGTVRRLRSNTSATTVTWADIDTGAEAASKTYYVYAVADTDATTFTCVISLSSSAPTDCTYYKRLGSFYNNSSSNILNDETVTNDNNYYALQLGDWITRSENVTYTASTDGYVVGLYMGGVNGIRAYAYSPASTMKARFVSSANGDQGWVAILVKKGDTYNVNATNEASGARYWIPLE